MKKKDALKCVHGRNQNYCCACLYGERSYSDPYDRLEHPRDLLSDLKMPIGYKLGTKRDYDG